MVRQAVRHTHGPEQHRRANPNDQNSKFHTTRTLGWPQHPTLKSPLHQQQINYAAHEQCDGSEDDEKLERFPWTMPFPIMALISS